MIGSVDHRERFTKDHNRFVASYTSIIPVPSNYDFPFDNVFHVMSFFTVFLRLLIRTMFRCVFTRI